jgi:hypothetical protein
MPIFAIGVLIGAGGVWLASDKAGDLVKWTVIGGGVYVAGKALKVI